MDAMKEHVRLIKPEESWRDEFIAYCEEFKSAEEPFVHGQLSDARKDFAGLIRRWAEGAKSIDLPQGTYLGNVLWLVRCGRILGSVRVRCRLNDDLVHEGGHLGYEVRPSERRKGYASLMLRLALEKAREMGLKQVLVTCQKDNIASVRTIEKNGGLLENEIMSKRTGKPALRYWIALQV